MPGTDKGVSPLIATVITIAFVVIIAAIASQFLTGFSQERASQVEREGSETVDCSLASIEIDPDSVKINMSGNNISEYQAHGDSPLLLTVENTGDEDLAIPEIITSNTSAEVRDVWTATRKSDDTQITTSDPIEEGEVLTIHNDTIQYTPDRITVTTSCSGVTAGVARVNTTVGFEWEKTFEGT